MLQIALVTPMLPIPQDLTRGRYVLETARSLARLAKVRVFFQQARYPSMLPLKPRSILAGAATEHEHWQGLDVDAFTYPSLPVVTRGLNGLICSRALTPRLREFRPDVVLAYWVYPDGHAALLSARTLGVPCVVGALGSDIFIRSGISLPLTRQVVREADAVLTVSEVMSQYTIDTYGPRAENVHTIVNGFNHSVFSIAPKHESRRSLGLDPDDPMIVFVGRMIDSKGVIELLDAFVGLVRDRPRLRLALVGNGVMQDRLPRMISERQLDDHVLLAGPQPPEGVARWIAASDLLTLPSWTEGYPNVVVEALACGRPVVATDVGGTREILNDANGILIEPRDVPVLQRALAQALDRDWDEQALARSVQRSWDDVAAETLEVCEAVVARGRVGVARPA